ncbi:MAG: tetratricopeptide repeat protein [Acidobacteriota bacterium]
MGRRPARLAAALCLLLAAPLHAQSPVGSDAQIGWDALKAGDADRAATAFSSALRQHPNDAAAHLGAGVAAHLLGHDRDAVVSLGRALELEPRLVQAAELLGQLTYQQGDIDAAIQVYERALTRAPGTDAMRKRLEAWRAEATIHHTLTERHDGRFTITFDGQADDALATRAAGVLDAAYWRIGSALNTYPGDGIFVILYTEQQFRDITRAPAWAGGAFDGKIRVPTRGASQDLPQFDRILVHELAHAMVFSLAPRGVPAWLHEGLASYFERRDPASAQARLRRSTAPIPFSQLQGSFGQFSDAQAVQAYDESLIAADVLVRMLGPQVGVLLQGLGDGQSFEQALRRVGVQPADFESQFAERLKH